MDDLSTLGLMANTVVILAGVIVLLAKSKKNGKAPDEVSKVRGDVDEVYERLNKQVAVCTERFLKDGRELAQISTDVGNIKESIERIEKGLNGKKVT